MALKVFRVPGLMLREASLARTLPRTPEPTAAMTSPESIAGFHDEGAASLLPIYHFNALAINCLVPFGGHILDLGCGTGRFLAHLVSHRPDLHIIGLDFAEDMVSVGRRDLARAGLDGRIQLLHGDMRDFRKMVPSRTDLISSIFSLHHLTTRDDLLACLREISAKIIDEQARLWIFDHARPRRRRTAEEVSEIFTPDASPVFRRDSYNSLCASWSFGELKTALRETLPGAMNGTQSRLLPIYQIHWTSSRLTETSTGWIKGDDLSYKVRVEQKILSSLFPKTPQKIRTQTRKSGAREN